MVQTANSSPLNANDERRRGSVRVGAEKLRVVRRNNDTNDERAEPVEDSQTINESTSCLGNIASRRDGLTSTERDEFGRSDKGETSADKRSPVSQEIASVSINEIRFESPGIVPVSESKAALTIRTSAQHDGEIGRAH